MNEIKETWEVMIQYNGVSSTAIKPILFFFSPGIFILLLKSHSEVISTKVCKILKLLLGKCSCAY